MKEELELKHEELRRIRQELGEVAGALQAMHEDEEADIIWSSMAPSLF